MLLYSAKFNFQRCIKSHINDKLHVQSKFCFTPIRKIINVLVPILITLNPYESLAGFDQIVLDETNTLTKSSIDYIKKSLMKIKEAKDIQIYFICIRNLPSGVELHDYSKNLFYEKNLGPTDIIIVLVNKIARVGIYHGNQITTTIDEIASYISEEIYAPQAKKEQYSSAALNVNNKLVSLFLEKNESSKLTYNSTTETANFKTAKKTEESRSKYIAIIAVLLVIAFIVPMVQFFYYVKDE